MEVVIDGVRYVPKNEPQEIVIKFTISDEVVDDLVDMIKRAVKDSILREQRPGGLLNR